MADATERWLPAPDWETLYRVSNRGRVWSCRASRFLRQYPTGWGKYLTIGFSQGGKTKHFFVHTLVLLAFVGPCPVGQEARHGPAGKYVNWWPENLCWGTHAENMADKVRDGTLVKPSARLSPADVLECRRRWVAGERQEDLACEYGVSISGLNQAIHGVTWADVPVGRTRQGKIGTGHHSAKLTAEIVLEARRRYATGESQGNLAREFGVMQSTLHHAIHGLTWAHVQP